MYHEVIYAFMTVFETTSTQLWDVRDPLNPRSTSYFNRAAKVSIGNFSFRTGGAVFDDLWYSSFRHTFDGLGFDVKRPANSGFLPAGGGFISTPGPALDFSTADGELIVALDSAGIGAYDNSDPLNPEPIATYDTPGNAQALATDGEIVFIADGDGGLQILRWGNPSRAARWALYD